MPGATVVFHEDLLQWQATDPVCRALDSDPSLVFLGSSTFEVAAVPRSKQHERSHFGIGRWVDVSYRCADGQSESTVTAIRFGYGAVGPPSTAHGGSVAAGFDHCFGHCIRGIIGVGPQFLANLRVEYRAPVRLMRTYKCTCRVTKREVRGARVKVHMEAEWAEAAERQNKVLATASALFIAIADTHGKLSMHKLRTPEEVLNTFLAARHSWATEPLLHDETGVMLAPLAVVGPRFSCRAGVNMQYEPTRTWLETDPFVQRIRDDPSLLSLDEAEMQSLGVRRMTSTPQRKDLGVVAVLDDRIMEHYALHSTSAAIVGAVRFLPITRGPPGRAHGGAVATLMDESFVWLTLVTLKSDKGKPGGTAWLELSLRQAVPLGETLRVDACLTRVEITDPPQGRRMKVSCKSTLSTVDEEGKAKVTLCEAKTLLVLSGELKTERGTDVLASSAKL
eukprot:gnl/TRDRNA2_/TRDRNA2_200321_c0_seq1.p1 gnl/TRDRNA2_/TRDRNA2_200321_c0~~gnl/TRDRNA2_/TRDRNA2_200321_c0_seq1.p1  ORF type:complete len:459 (-),score=71.79 gnl/TRDRNA2_/TRDRNA2_200321_c0_seq1:11-1360(-)